jgi:RNA polymerase sigma factor (sigma-70 family)
MMHHNRHFIAATDVERRAVARRRRRPADAGELERLMLSAARGEGAGWEALVKRFTVRLRSVARIHRLSPDDADDVVQNTWLQLFEHIHSVREPAALGAWLETTARRESLRMLRAAKREQPTDEELLSREVAEPVAEREAIATERRAALAESVERLPSTQRRLMTALLAYPTPSYQEISKALDTPVGSIGPTRARSLVRLRRDPALVRAIEQKG